MSSLKSVRHLLDTKSSSRKSSKSTSRSNSKSSYDLSSSRGSNSKYDLATSVEIEPTMTLAMKAQSVLHNKTPNMKELLAGRSSKLLVSFEDAKTALPVGAHVAYVLHRLFKDRKTGELKNVYCNSAFYRGTIDIRSRDISTKKEVVTPVLIVVSGKSTFQLAEDEIKEFYVFENQSDFAKTPKERSVEQKRKERERSKSLDHASRSRRSPSESPRKAATPRNSPTSRTDEILNRKVKDRSSLLTDRTRKTKSLVH